VTGTGTPMPAAFIGHGTPMNAVGTNAYTEAWGAFGASVPRPRAILAISAHWCTDVTTVTAMGRPRTIHDFFGFPQELFAVRYPAPGAPELAEEVMAALSPTEVRPDPGSWGLDHGTWSVLVHAFPEADVPVVQLSIDRTKPLSHHFDLGTRLAPLCSTGVLVMGSGNIVHNLGASDPTLPPVPYDWARRFNEAAVTQILDDPERVGCLRGHPDFALAVPTVEHFVPFVSLAGVAAASPGRSREVLVDGYLRGSLSMTSIGVGV
jgi:4,5-DOPA dioxygenase extradiol